MIKKYIVRLSKKEQKELKEFVSKGKTAAYKIKHANILLEADANGVNQEDKAIAKIFRCHEKTVFNVRKRLVEEGLERAITRKTQTTLSRAKILDGSQEAQLIAMSCTKPPEGRDRWTLKMLSDNMVALEIVDNISSETVRKTLKKTS